MKRIFFRVFFFSSFLCVPSFSTGQVVEQVIDIAPAWAGHRVGFDLQTLGDYQYVAFYDEERRMTIGQRRLDEDSFRLIRLPETVEWDSHNYITLTKDDDDFLHVTGNMHGVPLIYFRSDRPNDIESFSRIPAMVGRDETRVTYPRFFRGPANVSVRGHTLNVSVRGHTLNIDSAERIRTGSYLEY